MIGNLDLQRRLATEALITTMEGIVLHGASSAKAGRTIHYLLDRLAPLPAGGRTGRRSALVQSSDDLVTSRTA